MTDLQLLPVLALAASLFVGTHFLMSHPLRSFMVASLGNNGFFAAYSLVSFATFGFMLWAAARVGEEQLLWLVGDGLWLAASLFMWAGSILFVGAFRDNPALPDMSGGPPRIGEARGVFAISRHPMMWGFALWGLVHLIVAARPSTIIISVAIITLALGGAAGQDHKKLALYGPAWRQWMDRTSFVPFARGWSLPGAFASLGGTLLFVAATWAHGALGGVAAGPWRWIG